MRKKYDESASNHRRQSILLRPITMSDTEMIVKWRNNDAVLLFLGGVILLVLGLIGEYVGRIFMCTNAAPQFVLREVVKRENHGKIA